jgi:organic radical activating enzyme
MKLRYSEAFYSVQGEGKFVGVPSVFLRTFGCNFRCMNFGLGKDEPSRAEKHEAGQRYNQEVLDLLDSGIIAKTEKFTDLPIIQGVTLMQVSIPSLKTLTNLQKLKK